MSQVQERNRITCVLQLYHEQDGEQPDGVRLAFVAPSKYNVQRYQRRMKIDEADNPLDIGWFKPHEVGSILIENLEGKGLQVQPTDEEREDIARRIIDVREAGGTSSWLVPPGGFFLGCPSSAEKVLIRCQHGSAKIGLSIYPR